MRCKAGTKRGRTQARPRRTPDWPASFPPPSLSVFFSPRTHSPQPPHAHTFCARCTRHPPSPPAAPGPPHRRRLRAVARGRPPRMRLRLHPSPGPPSPSPSRAGRPWRPLLRPPKSCRVHSVTWRWTRCWPRSWPRMVSENVLRGRTRENEGWRPPQITTRPATRLGAPLSFHGRRPCAGRFKFP